MFTDGKLITTGHANRVPDGPLGVRTWEPERCWDGYTLFSHQVDDTEYLMDMNGRIVHRWDVTASQYAELRSDGEMVYGSPTIGVQALEPDGSEVWTIRDDRDYSLPFHHDFGFDAEGDLFYLSRKPEPPVEKVYRDDLVPERMLTDVIFKRDVPSGELLWEFSFSEHIDEIVELSGLPLPFPYHWYYETEEEAKDSLRGGGVKGPEQEYGDGYLVPEGKADWAHTNTVSVIPENPLGNEDERFRAGNLVFSLRNLDVIGIIDPEKDEVVWCYGLGVLDGQHQPVMLENGHILVYDNGTYRGHSIVREIDPVEKEIVWQYGDDGSFFSHARSGVQRLPNGNTLVCESHSGRLFEVTPEKEIVWDFYTPFFGHADRHEGPNIYRAVRYPPEAVEPIIEAREDRLGGAVAPHVDTYADLVEYYRGNRKD